MDPIPDAAIVADLQVDKVQTLQPPINKVPDDVLWSIFEELAGVRISRPQDPDSNAYGITRNRWMEVLLVCRHWRAVALADPFLWTVIKCDPCHDRTHRLPGDRKSTRLNSSHSGESRMPSSA